MIRFQLALLFRTTRWVAPAVFCLAWFGVTAYSGDRLVDTAAFMFPVVLLASIWLTVVVGRIDDRPHRDFLAAAVGGQGSLHSLRLAASVGIGGAITTATVALSVVINGIPSNRLLVVAGFGVLLSAVFLGAGAGCLLHPPFVSEVGVAAIAGPVFLVAVMLAPPVQWSIRQTNRESTQGAMLLVAGSIAALGLVGLVGRLLAARA